MTNPTTQTIILNSIVLQDTDGGPDVIVQHGQHPGLAHLKQLKGGHYVEVQEAGGHSGIGPLGRKFMSEGEAVGAIEAELAALRGMGYVVKPAGDVA